MDRQTDRQTDGRTDGRTDRQTDNTLFKNGKNSKARVSQAGCHKNSRTRIHTHIGVTTCVLPAGLQEHRDTLKDVRYIFSSCGTCYSNKIQHRLDSCKDISIRLKRNQYILF